MRKTLVALLVTLLFALGFPQKFLEVLNPPSLVVIERSLNVSLKALENVFVTLLLNDAILERASIEAGQTREFRIPLDRVRNKIVFEARKNGEGQTLIFEVTYLPRVHAVVDKSFSGENGELVDGVPHFNSVQKAIDYLRERRNNDERLYVFVKNGDYYEKITIDVPNLSLIGEDVYKTRLYYDLAAGVTLPDGKTVGTSGSASVTITSKAVGFTAENITFENSFDESNPEIKSKQAVAVLTQSDRAVFKNCRFIGNQDTLYVRGGLHYFVDCYIEGDVDFIFGDGQAVFEKCTIFSVDRPGIKPKGYVTAASTKQDKLGFLFLNCEFVSNVSEPGSVYLGRPWHPSSDPYSVNSNVVIMECYLGEHVHPDGWTSMSSKDPKTGETIWFHPETERFFEYKNYGPGAVVNEKRPQLTTDLLDLYSKEKFLQGWDVEEFLKNLYR